MQRVNTRAQIKKSRDMRLATTLDKELAEFEPKFKYVFGDVYGINIATLKSKLKHKMPLEQSNTIRSQILFNIKEQIRTLKEKEGEKNV